MPVFYVPGEHDVLGRRDGKHFLDRFGKGTDGRRLVQLRPAGVHFVALVNVVNLKAGGQGALGADQLAWLKDDLAAPDVLDPDRGLRPHAALGVYPGMGLGHRRVARRRWRCCGASARSPCSTATSTRCMQKVEGNVTFHTARSTAYPQPAPGTPGASPGR